MKKKFWQSKTSISALKEARYILTTNPLSKYGVHYIDHPVYKEILKDIDTKINMAKQALDLWKSGALY